MVDFWSGLGGGLIGALAAFIVAREQIKAAREDARQARDESRREREATRVVQLRETAAKVVDETAVELQGMAREFRADRIPHSNGHAFVRMLGLWETTLRPYLDTSLEEELERMRGLAERATRLDDQMRVLQDVAESPAAVAADCERAAGDLRALATSLRSGSLLPA